MATDVPLQKHSRRKIQKKLKKKIKLKIKFKILIEKAKISCTYKKKWVNFTMANSVLPYEQHKFSNSDQLG